MTTIAELQTKLSMDAAQYFETAKNVARQTNEMARVLESAKETVKSLFEIEVIRRAGEELIEIARHGAEAAEQIEHFAQRTGESIADVQALSYASQVLGLSQDALSQSLNKFSKIAAEAAGGSQKQAEAFAAMGISVKDADGHLRPMKDLLGDVADKFESYSDGPAKAALAQALFGRSGADMIPFLNKGRVGIADLGDEAKKLGFVLNDQAIKALKDLAEDFHRSDLAGSHLKNILAGDLAPVFETLTKSVIEGSKKGGDFDETMHGIGAVATLVAEAFVFTGAVVAGVIHSVLLFGDVVNRVLHGDVSGAVEAARREFKQMDAEAGASAKTMVAMWGKTGEAVAEVAEKVKKDAPLIGGQGAGIKEAFAETNAHAQASLALLKENLRERMAVLQDQYRADPQQLAEFYSKRIAIEQEGSAKEIEVLKQQIEQTKALQSKARAGGDEKEELSLKAKLIELTGRLDLAELKRLNDAKDGSRELAAALRQEALAIEKVDIESHKRMALEDVAILKEQLDQSKALEQVSQAGYIASLRRLEEQRYRVELEAMKKSLAMAGQTKTQKEQINKEIEIAEKDHQARMTAIDHQAEQERQKYAIEFADDFRGTATTALGDFLSGTKSAKDAFKEFANSMIQDIARIEAKKLIEQMLGASDGTGGGTAGGGMLAQLANSMFGPGKASGGDVTPGSSFMVGEQGPEMFVPAVAGHIIPAGQWGGASVVNHIHISAPNGRVSAETEQQVMTRVGLATAAAMRRGA